MLNPLIPDPSERLRLVHFTLPVHVFDKARHVLRPLIRRIDYSVLSVQL